MVTSVQLVNPHFEKQCLPAVLLEYVPGPSQVGELGGSGGRCDPEEFRKHLTGLWESV